MVELEHPNDGEVEVAPSRKVVTQPMGCPFTDSDEGGAS
jgi:hypothetical protein